jgi:hypothetical protein
MKLMNEPAVCEFCGQTFTARQTGQRFCCRDHGLEYFQQEKRDAIAWYRRFRAERVEEAQQEERAS